MFSYGGIFTLFSYKGGPRKIFKIRMRVGGEKRDSFSPKNTPNFQ